MGRGDKDMTLKLSDDLLLRVLSFLPTKDALRTSVLSRRWRYLWTSFSKIHLDDSIPYDNRPRNYPRCRTSFLHFVYRLLLGHDDSDIKRFNVSCDVHVDAVCVHSWISAVIKHNVRKLRLSFPLTGSCILPSCLFSSRSLVILCINLRGVIRFPSLLSSGCPCLKSLNFSRVEFLNDDSTKKLFSDLSSIFPTLRQLSLVRCGWKNIKDLIVAGVTLVSITMNVENYSGSLDCEVVVIAPNLASFYCETDSSIGICLAHPTSLSNASLKYALLEDQPEGDEQVIAYKRLVEILGEMRYSKRLTLSTETLLASNDSFEQLPVFVNLTYLHISGWVLPRTIDEVLKFMQKAPNLEYLSASLECDYVDIDDRIVNPVPSFPINRLKKLKVSGLDTQKHEKHLIKFVLENACNLEKIKVCAYKMNAAKLETIRNELVALPRSSEKCVFIFEVLPDEYD